MKSTYLRFLAGVVLWLAFCVIGLGQEPAYLHYDEEDGLPSSLIYCGLQDRQGYMWFGTDKGLARFDGVRFKVFDIKQGLLDNEVLEVFEDSRQRIWISCFYNKPSYVLNNKVYTAESDSLLGKIDIKGGAVLISEDSQGNIWITRDQDKCCKLSPSNKLSYYNSPLKLINEKLPLRDQGKKVTIIKMMELENEIYLYAGNSILHIDSSGVFTKVFELELGRQYTFNSLAVNGKRILISHGNLLILLSYEDGKFKIIDKNESDIKGKISVDKRGRFWVSTINKGAICFDHQKHLLSQPITYLKHKKITNTFEDAEGTMWFSTLNEGLFALPKNAAIQYTKEGGAPFNSNNIISVNKLENGQIVLGDDTGNVYFKQGANWEQFTIGSEDGYNRVQQVSSYSDGSWLAVSEEMIYSSKLGRLKEELGMGAFKTAFLLNNNIWLGSSHGLLIKENIGSKTRRVLNSRTTSIALSSDSIIWAGGLNGIYSSKDSFQTNWGNFFKPLSRRIISIKGSGKDKLLVATSNYGLLDVALKDGTITNVKVLNDSLTSPIENIQSFFIEPNGKTWLATNSGVYSLDDQLTVRHFDEVNGLISNNVNSILVNNDTLWVATVAGVSKFILKDGADDDNFKTKITGIRYSLAGKKIDIDMVSYQEKNRQLSLPAGATMLELDLTGLYFRAHGNFHFEYQTIEELLPTHLITFGNLFNVFFRKSPNKALIQSTSQIFGVNLTPGQFKSTFTAILPSGIHSKQSDQITIIVQPHWWQTIWVSLIVLGLVIFAIVRVFKTRSAFLKLQGTASELQLQAIKSQMNPHFVGNSINAIQQFFYPPDPVKASEYISTFSDLLRRTMDFAEVDFISFEEELEYVKDYLEMVKLRFGDRFNYSISGENAIDQQVKFPAMLLQPILENATIHGLSPDTPSMLTVDFAQQDDIVYCTVTDNGVGIEASLLRKSQKPVRRTSKGLKLLDKKIQMLNKLYSLHLQITTTDRSQLGDTTITGTQVAVSFSSSFTSKTTGKQGEFFHT